VSGNSTLKQQGMPIDGKQPHRAITGPAIERRSCRRNFAGITRQSQHRRQAVGGHYRLQPGAAGGNRRAIDMQPPAPQIFTAHQVITGTGRILTPHEQEDRLG